MYIYSGNCRLGVVGNPTPFLDIFDAPLFVGDIVLTFTDDYAPDHLTAVVSDEYTSFSDGTHIVREGPIHPFVMGIKGEQDSPESTWKVRKVKDHSDVIAGESWKDFGFHYSEK
jgi:hypothetical protein